MALSPTGGTITKTLFVCSLFQCVLTRLMGLIQIWHALPQVMSHFQTLLAIGLAGLILIHPTDWLRCCPYIWEYTLSTMWVSIVNGGDWLWSPANIKGANKDAKIYVRRSTTLHNLLFCVHTLCMNYVTSTFLLVSSSVRSKQLLCFVQGQGQKREQKHTTKNFVGFHNHSLY